MSIVLDTSVVIAAMSAGEVHHATALEFMRTVDEDLVTTPLALAEMDHFAAVRGGRSVQEALWNDFDRGALGVSWWADGLRDSIAVARTRPDVGLTDASLVALAGRLNTSRVATLDHRHFRTLTTRDGQPFALLPADA